MTLASGITLPVEGIAEICRKYQVRELSVFGSAARGDMRPDSDMDLLVEFQPEAHVGLFKFAQLQGVLGEILGCKVDLATPDALRGEWRADILREAVDAA